MTPKAWSAPAPVKAADGMHPLLQNHWQDLKKDMIRDQDGVHNCYARISQINSEIDFFKARIKTTRVLLEALGQVEERV